jgi:membrane fusion protein, multidrug efflux system
MRTRTRAITGAVALAGIASVLAMSGGSAPAASNDGNSALHVDTARVERRDLVDRETVAGTLGYGDARALVAAASGTVTALPAEGTTVDRGQTLLEVDGRAIPLFFGDRPFWRLMARDTEGEDVRELEANLAALGYGDRGLVVDTKFDAATQRAVKRWQDALGRDDTGVVTPSDVVVQPGAVRVAEHKVDVGSPAQPGAAVMTVTGTSRLVTVRLDTDKRSYVHAGDAVRVEMPDGRVVGGKVFLVGRVATADSSDNGQGDSTPQIDVIVVLDHERDAGDLDEAPVDVQVTRDSAQHVLAVPVRALLALAEGGYAVEVQRNGTRTLVGVETGAFADGWVEVTGRLQAGDRVVVAQ